MARQHPGQSGRHVEVGVETFQARATITTGAERQRLWAAHVAAIPHFANYEKMTERELQVVTIERLAADVEPRHPPVPRLVRTTNDRRNGGHSCVASGWWWATLDSNQ